MPYLIPELVAKILEDKNKTQKVPLEFLRENCDIHVS